MDMIVVEEAVGVGEGRGARGVMRRVTELTSGKVPLEKTLQWKISTATRGDGAKRR